MRALIIGASGQVGGRLTKVFSENGYEVSGTRHKKDRPDLLALSLGEESDVQAAFEAARPTVAFLSAARTAVDWCESNRDDVWHVNVTGTEQIARACKAHGTKLVYYSTEYVFDGVGGPYTEEDPPNAVSVYGASKLEGERVLASILDDYLICRTTVVYSWDPGGLNFVMQLERRLGAGEAMTVPEDQISNPTLAEDLAEATYRLVRDSHTGIFNTVGKDRLGRYEFALRTADAFGLDRDLIRPVKTSDLNQDARRPLDAGLTIDKVERAVGPVFRGVGEALSEVVRQMRSHSADA